MKILVIGSNGFLGNNIAQYFKNKGHEIWGCGTSNKSMDRTYFKVDSFNPEYEDIFKLCSFDACINASGSKGVGFSFNTPDKDFKLNVANVYCLLNSIRKYNPSCHFINLSSAAVYGNPIHLPVKESDPLHPISPYGYHKIITEKLIEEFRILFNIRIATVRIFSVYGIGLRNQLFWDIYRKTKLNNKIELSGTGNETRDFIFITDLLHAIELILIKDNFQGSIYNIANGTEISIQEAANTFLQLIDKRFILKFSGLPKLGDPNYWRADITKITSLGYYQQYDLKVGLKIYHQWLNSTEKE